MTIVAIAAAAVIVVALLTVVAWRICHQASKTQVLTQRHQRQGTGVASNLELDALVLTPSAPPADVVGQPKGIPIAHGGNEVFRDAQLTTATGPSAPPAELVQAVEARLQTQQAMANFQAEQEEAMAMQEEAMVAQLREVCGLDAEVAREQLMQSRWDLQNAIDATLAVREKQRREQEDRAQRERQADA